MNGGSAGQWHNPYKLELTTITNATNLLSRGSKITCKCKNLRKNKSPSIRHLVQRSLWSTGSDGLTKRGPLFSVLKKGSRSNFWYMKAK